MRKKRKIVDTAAESRYNDSIEAYSSEKEREMSQAGITLLIIAGLCVLYIIDKLPVALVTTIGMLALVFSGGLTFSEAFSCFGSTPVVLTFGMVIIINAIIESGMIRV